jgi:hypothetical protein
MEKPGFFCISFRKFSFVFETQKKKRCPLLLSASSIPIYIEENLLLRRFFLHTVLGVGIGTVPHMTHIRIDDHAFFDCCCDKGFC